MWFAYFVAELIPQWQERMKTWRAWMCSCTKQTLRQVRQGVPHSKLGAGSNAVAIRFAPAFAYFDDEEDLVHAARTAMFTHRERTALDAGEFFARVTFRVIHRGMAPKDAIIEVAKRSTPFIQKKVRQALQKVRINLRTHIWRQYLIPCTLPSPTTQ